MRYIEINAELHSEKEVILNNFLGSTVRGAIISAISKLYCTHKDLQCTACNEGVTCPNKILFNMKSYMKNDRVSNTIVINAFQKCSTNIVLDIILFGIGITAAETIKDILLNGIYLGKNREQFRADKIYFLDGNKQYEKLVLAKTKNQTENTSRVVVDFISPAHIQKECMTLDFSNFLKCCMYRYMSVNQLTQSEPEIDFHGLLENAKSIKTIERTIKIENLERFSGRTQVKNEVHCVKGRLVYEGELNKYMNILRLIEVVNIGKWSSMGLGHIRITSERI